MIVEIWSDILCPWCYIGKRELESALAQFKHKEKVEVIWKSFELDPSAKKDYDGNLYDLLASKYNLPVQKARDLTQALVKRAQQVGLSYNMDIAKATNSFDAHRLIHLAKTYGQQEKVIEGLSAAYLTFGQHIGRHETLVQVGENAGLKAADTTAMLNSNAYADEVRADEYEAQNIGIKGVPFFLIDRKYSISGAQPKVALLEALHKIWDELYPDSNPSPTSSTDLCDADRVCDNPAAA